MTSLDALLVARRNTLALVDLEPLREGTVVTGLPGVWSPRRDGAPGATVDLADGETLRIAGREVGGTVALDPSGMVSPALATFGGGLEVVVFPDPADGVTWVGYADPASAQLAAFQEVVSYPYDERWRIPVSFEPASEGERATVLRSRTAGQQGSTMPRLGWFVAVVDGRGYRLEVSTRGPGMPYVNFRDATSGVESYGAGRFVPLPVPPAEVEMLDLNAAILPPCALNPLVSCPLPPEGNVLHAEVRAGERLVLFAS